MSNHIGQYITATLMRHFNDVIYCCFLSFFFSVNYVKMLYMHMYVCMYVKFGESWWRDDKSSTNGSLSRCMCTECTLDVCSQLPLFSIVAIIQLARQCTPPNTRYPPWETRSLPCSMRIKKERILGTEASIIKQ